MARKIGKNPTGAQKSPTMTPEVLRKLELAFSMGANQAEACLHADIPDSTFSSWKYNNPEQSEKMLALRKKPALIAKFTLLKGIEKNPALALKYLERVNRDEFSLRSENINHNISLNDVLDEFEDPAKDEG